jgi:hypothetical protein
MKAITIVSKNESAVLEFTGQLTKAFNKRGLKMGLFINKEESIEVESDFYGCTTSYQNYTSLEVQKSFLIDDLISIFNCDFLVAVNMILPDVPKVLLPPYDETTFLDSDLIGLIKSDGLDLPVELPCFDPVNDMESLVAYLWLNGKTMISNKHIKLNEQFIEYADRAKRNVAVVKIHSNYGYEIICIKKFFQTSEGAEQEAFYASVLNKTIKVYPQVIDVVKTVLYREFVHGEKLNEVVEKYANDEGERVYYYLESIILSVVDTINFIHNELEEHYNEAYSIGNTCFENFLIAEDTVYYLELNGIRPGDCVCDFEQFAARILACEEIRTNDKRALINGLIQYINKSFYYQRELKWSGIESAFELLHK